MKIWRFDNSKMSFTQLNTEFLYQLNIWSIGT